MTAAYAWFMTKYAKWCSMSPNDQFLAGVHASLDALLLVFFLAAIWTALTTNPNAMFWALVCGFIGFLRLKQAKSRWSL